MGFSSRQIDQNCHKKSLSIFIDSTEFIQYQKVIFLNNMYTFIQKGKDALNWSKVTFTLLQKSYILFQYKVVLLNFVLIKKYWKKMYHGFHKIISSTSILTLIIIIIKKILSTKPTY